MEISARDWPALSPPRRDTDPRRTVVAFTSPHKEIHLEDKDLKRVKSSRKPQKLFLEQLTTIESVMTSKQKAWWNDRRAMRELNNFLAEVGRKHEEELNAGKPLNLKLAKVRRHD